MMSNLTLHELHQWIYEYENHLKYYQRAKTDDLLEGDIDGSIEKVRRRLEFLRQEATMMDMEDMTFEQIDGPILHAEDE